MSNYNLVPDLAYDKIEKEPIRAGFDRGLKQAADNDDRIVALCADLVDSVKLSAFHKAYPERYIETGIAEQNLAAVAAGLARAGKIPFAASYAAFNPGRNWEQIKTTACINNLPVKIIGGHAGVTVGPDGATHQMLEDITITRVLPRMVVIAPGDSIEAEKATMALARTKDPTYIRLARPKTPIFSTSDSPFEIGKAYILRDGTDVSLLGTGTMTYHMLWAADILAGQGINAEVVHVPTIKPLDESTILDSARRTGRVVTGEEAQVAGGFGGTVAELLSEQLPTPLHRIGIHDRFGESGEPEELMDFFGLTGPKIAEEIKHFVDTTPQYRH